MFSPRIRFIGLGVAAALCLGVAACSTASTDRLIASVDNFTRGLAAVDQAVKKVNATLYSQCDGLVTTAAAINSIAGSCSKASDYTATANAIVLNYCQSQAVAEAGIAKSLSVTASAVSAAKSTLSANKKACS